ncbi:MAG: trehalose-6-phosphate synthase [candidate division KSB1 bacterium]|jgi:trehalose 6-phosphate synthase|nr:trehalose-6-phosphate synthase [candidate division KSB1 bacterium]
MLEEKKEVHGRVIILSNRLPILVSQDDTGQWKIEPGSGGLVTALAPVLKNRGGIWIGWPGTVQEDEVVAFDHLLENAIKDAGYRLVPIFLSDLERERYYKGFSNEVLWPLFHDFQSYCNFDPEYWEFYEKVNLKFAKVTHQNAAEDDFIWVHDYHLINVAAYLRQMGSRARIGYFLHTPFPPLDIYLKLPWRFQLLKSLMEYDLVGFQTMRDRRNFLQCIRTLMKNVVVRGKGTVISLTYENRQIRVGSFPISIDFSEFENLARGQAVTDGAWYLHENFPEQKIIFGVDRLDYSKGIIEKLKAFRIALERYPDLREKVILVQVLVPSRRSIPMYARLKEEIERLVGEINGQFTTHGWVPIHYIYRSLNRVELLSYYRTAEVMLVTPLKDGMNLVAKEYCASNLEQSGVIVLSEFAGVVSQFYRNAVLVNPYDNEGVADAIHEAVIMPEEQRRGRMNKLRHSVKKADIYWWVNSFLSAAIAKRLDNFPIIEDYIPEDAGDKDERTNDS